MLDGISLYAIRRDLERYLPMKVQKIYHPSGKELLFALWSREAKGDLVVSQEGNVPFLGFVSQRPEMPKVASGICIGLRNRLEGGVLHQVRQEGMDRIIYCDFTGHDDFGSPVEYTLVLDGAGSGGGIGLLENGTVILAIPTRNRRFDPGEPYVPPESGKWNLLSESDMSDLASEICSKQEPAYKSLVSHIDGLGKDLALSIVAKMGLSRGEPFAPDNRLSLCDILTEIRNSLVSASFCPALYFRQSGEPVFGVFPLYHLERGEDFGSLFEGVAAYRAYAAHFSEYTVLESRVRSIHKAIKNKVMSRFMAQKQDLDKALEFEKFRIWAELINSTGKELPGGHDEIKVLNYYKEPPEEIYIPLDPRFSSRENARRYYSKYAKLKRTQKVLETSLKEAAARFERLSVIEGLLDRENDVDSLLLIQEQLVKVAREADVRIPRARRRTETKISKHRVPAHGPKESVDMIHGADGAIAYAGTNARANDYLVRHVRKPGDIWLHAKGMRGAHVLLRISPGNVLTADHLDWAAGIAAQRSEAAGAGKVEVDWVDAANVRKPGGSPLGFVTYKGAKTLVVKIV
jgi:predicted ribosome quality control (RQC) complex YloA/Tae2 family protein